MSKDERDDERPLLLFVGREADEQERVQNAVAPRLEVVGATDTQSLAVALGGAPVDVVVLDARGEDETVGEDVRAVRALPELTGVPLLALTSPSLARRELLFSLGVDDCVVSPFSSVELSARALRLVSDKRVRDTLARGVGGASPDIDHLAVELADRLDATRAALGSVTAERDRGARALEMKTQFLAMVSHELRTPLGALRLQLDRLRRDRQGRLGPGERLVVDHCLGCARRLDDLVETLLEYARVESGHVPTRSESFDLAALVRDTIEELSPRARAKSLGIELAVPDDLKHVTSDPKLLRVCFLNLLSNAIKFTDVGTIRVEVARTDLGYRVAVSDSGPGIEPALQETIFEAFQRGPATQTDRTSGFGLGLSLVKELATSLGGRVAVVSRPGAGSTFTIELPAR